MTNSLSEILKGMVGLECSRREVGRSRSLSLGFGSESQVPLKVRERGYREWEIGTYRSAWRVVCSGIVLCGSQDLVDSIGDLESALLKVELGRFVSLRMVGSLDVRIEFDNDTVIDFLATISDDDEVFHIFCADGRAVEFSVRGGWRIGPSDSPWADGATAIESPETDGSITPKTG